MSAFDFRLCMIILHRDFQKGSHPVCIEPESPLGLRRLFHSHATFAELSSLWVVFETWKQVKIQQQSVL